MRRCVKTFSATGKLVVNKLDPGVFVVEVPETGRKINLGQPPDVVKRLQQVGYFGANGVTTFVLVDSKVQADSISWCLTEFPILYALYFIMVKKGGRVMPAFHAGRHPMLAGVEEDVRQALAMIKYGNYGVDRLEELDALDIPRATRDALRKEILGLAVDNVIKDSEAFINPVVLERRPRSEGEFSDLGDGIRLGRIGHNRYRFMYGGESVDVDATLAPQEEFRSPVEYKHMRFPVINFGIWHTGEFDGMDPYYSCAHTSIIHKYEPLLVDYPANMTEIINHNGLSKESINTVLVTHNHDDHIGAMVELFRRSEPCRIITTEPVRYSVVKKLAALVNLPEGRVEDNFRWTLLPFRKDNPFQTETYNLDGIQITGHLSCHSVPTTIYTLHTNHDGYEYSYGHFLDIVAFRRMKKLVRDGWMPGAHLEHLERIIRKTSYNLVKYDAGCLNDEALPFTVHGQWQDLKGAATQRRFRVFTHASRHLLDPAFENEGRFVNLGDLDATLFDPGGRLVRLGAEKTAVTAFYQQGFQAVRAYFESLIQVPLDSPRKSLIDHYAMAFANCAKQPDLNIGAFLIHQGDPADSVRVLVRGRAEELTQSRAGKILRRSIVGDGEVVGDLAVLSGKCFKTSVKPLNRLSYLTIPDSLFLEAMEAVGIEYQGQFKALFERRGALEAAHALTRDVSTLVLNRIAREARARPVKKGEAIFKQGQRDGTLWIVPKAVELRVKDGNFRINGPTVIGEMEYFQGTTPPNPTRLGSAVALAPMEVLGVEPSRLFEVPVITDNLRRLIGERTATVYAGFRKVRPNSR